MARRVLIDRDYESALNLGDIKHIEPKFYFFKVADFDIADGEVIIWDSALPFDGILPSAEVVNIVSTSTDDDSAGTGARIVLVRGIVN